MKKFVTNKGFTIVELLIASVIISAGLLAVVSMVLNAFTSTIPLSQNLTASHLAQEGFEIIRRIRDTNFNKRHTEDDAEDLRWLDNLIEEGDDYAVGGVDYNSTRLEEGRENDFLYINEEDGLFGYDQDGAAEETSFRREIELTRDCYDGYDDDDFEDDYCGDGEAEYILVNIIVSWDRRGETRSYEAETKLFNWY